MRHGSGGAGGRRGGKGKVKGDENGRTAAAAGGGAGDGGGGEEGVDRGTEAAAVEEWTWSKASQVQLRYDQKKPNITHGH